jgi:hypothetical protein
MNYYTFIGHPKCKTCGRKMDSWNPWASEHEHHKCTLDRLAKVIQEDIKKIFKTGTNAGVGRSLPDTDNNYLDLDT